MEMKFGKDTYAIALICIIGILLILGLSWQSDPNLKGLPFIPSWLYNWTDSYKNATIRTAVPFVGLSLVIGIWLSLKKASFNKFILAWFILIGVVVLAELGQYFIPSRDADIKDVFWGMVGSFIGLGIMLATNLLTRLFRLKSK